MTAPGPARQRSIYLAGVSGRKPAVPTAPAELERAAKEAMSREAWAYVAGGAGAGNTMRANREAFDRQKIVPRMLTGSTARDMSVELFGKRYESPILLAPVGVLEMAHAEADAAVARACREERVPLVVSSQASVPMERIAAELRGSPWWFQLYMGSSNEIVTSFVRRAESAGAAAIALTVDTTMLGWRTADLDLASLPFLKGMGIAQYTSDPAFRKLLAEPAPSDAATPKPGVKALANLPGLLGRARRAGLPLSGFIQAIRRFTSIYWRPLSWEDVRFLRDLTQLPVLLKGIQRADDASRALDAGVDGLIVSNHGGRQVDGGIATLDALPAVIAAVGDRIPVLVDSGVRGGADVFKALALGARAALLGRPYIYGLALAGEEGVREVMRNVIAELDLTLGLAGCDSVAGIREDMLAQ